MTTYRILYQVETTENDGRILLQTFTTQHEAESHIAQQKQMTEVTYKSEGNLPRNWRDK